MSGASGSGASGSGMSGSGMSGSAGAGASGSNGGSNGTNGSSTTNTTGSTTATLGSNGLAVIVMQGTTNSLTLYVSRVPPNPAPTNVPGGGLQIPGVSDQHRIVYWLVDGGGLARQEVTATTSDDAVNSNVPSGATDPNSKQLLAQEVKSLQFEYFDGTEWNDTWDGSQLGVDGITPIGSPVAVAVILGLAVPGTDEVKTYRHVVAIPTANNPTPLQSSTSTGTTGSSGGSGTGGTTSP